MIQIGKYNSLKILRQTSVGLFLGDDSGEEVLLPKKYSPENFSMDDVIDVFVYPDNEGRKIATNLVPKIQLNEFALLRVSAVNEVGAFLDWGLDKELLVPFKEQRQKMEVDRWYIVYLVIDEETDRLYATNKLEKHLLNEDLTVSEGAVVEVLVMQKTDLGFSVIVNNLHKGLIFDNEIFTTLNVGDKLTGYVKKIREDQKLDISIQALGFRDYNDANTKTICSCLEENEGFISLTDKSTPDEIYEQLGMSKKAFKKSIGTLYKQRKISIGPDGIRTI